MQRPFKAIQLRQLSDDVIDNPIPLPWGQVATLLSRSTTTFAEGVKDAIAISLDPLQVDVIELWLYQANQLEIYSSQAGTARTAALSGTHCTDAVQWLKAQTWLTAGSHSIPQLFPLLETGLLPLRDQSLFVSVLEGDHSIGCLWFHRVKGEPWTDRDRDFARYLANMVKMAFRLANRVPSPPPNPIAELELQQAEKAWQESQRLLQSIAETSTSILYLCDVKTHQLLYANPQIEKILGYTLAEFQSFQDKFSTHIIHSEDYPRFKRHCARVLRLKEGEIAEGEYRFRAKDESWRWLLLRETVVNQDESIGGYGQVCGTATDITRLKQTELALEEANQELRRLSITDALTNLANRRRMGDFLQTLWQKPQTEYRPVAVILCDIDYFKLYNDAYGHPAGDRCLQQVSRVLRYSAKRSTDLVARHGGEEFAIVLPKTNIVGAKIVAERIRVGLAGLQIPHEYSQVSGQVTLSIGIAIALPQGSETPTELISLADQALYQAKGEGRDRYCVAAS